MQLIKKKVRIIYTGIRYLCPFKAYYMKNDVYTTTEEYLSQIYSYLSQIYYIYLKYIDIYLKYIFDFIKETQFL